MSDLEQHADNNDPSGGDAFVFPASFGQRRLWFLDQLEPGSAAYNISLATRLRGNVNSTALQAALNDLVARHETLRTSFDVEDDEPVQVVEETGSIKLQVQDGSGLSEDALNHQLLQLASQGFDLKHGPLVSAHLIHTDTDDSVLLLNIHHSIADAWSLGILYGELVALYEQHSGGKSAALSELEIQYGDFAEWQQGWLESDDYKTQLNYWTGQLADAPPVLELPTDHPRPRVQTHNGAIITRVLPAKLAAELRTLAQSQSCTLFILLLAAYDVLLAKYSGSDDVVIGTPIAGRSRRELEPLIGFFVNTLAMRADLSGNPEFTALLKQVRSSSLEAYKHQDLPFEKLVEEIQPERMMSNSPIFQALFVLEHAATEFSPFSNLTAEALRVKTDTAKFDISMFISEAPDALSCTLEYNTDLFAAASIEKMLARFETLLQQITQQPDVHINDISLLSSDERTLVTTGFNATSVDFGELPPVHQLIEQQVAKTPNAIALEGVDEILSYAELNARANRLAHTLQQAGAAPGKIVAISCERSTELPVAVLAVLKSGAAYIPIDPNYPTDRIAYMLDDSGAAILLTQSTLTSKLPEHSASVILIDEFDFASGDDSNPASAVTANDPLYAIYTSGSTGLPKGVVLNHAGLANLIRWQQTQPGLDAAARTLQFASISFDVSFQELFTTWAQGGTLVMITEELRKDLPALAGLISEKSIERLYMPYAALQPLAEVLADRDDLRVAITDIVSAGEQLQITPAIRRLYKRCGGRLHNQYGPSETHVVTALTLEQPESSWPDLPSIGYPIANTACYVLDQNQQPVAQGIPGELYLAGIQVAREYLGKPELTAEKIFSDPFADSSGAAQRMYRSGDRVRHLPDGEIEYLGRIDDQVKFRGFRIEPAEIEAIISKHPDVQLASVLLRTDGEKKLVAYVTAEAGHVLETSTLKDFLKTRLPDYMLPTHYMVLDSMPLTPSGKIARRQLPEPTWERDAGDQYTAPGSELERSLCDIWSEVLSVEKVGIHDDFFDLGGHSLLATQVISRVRSRLGTEIALLKLFEAPTVAEFAALFEGGIAPDTIADDSIPVRASSGPAPLSFAQQRLWFLEQLDPGNPAYNFPIATRFGKELDRDALQKALNLLIERHESLRTRFVADGQTPKQEVLSQASIALEIIDLSGSNATNVQQRLTALSQQAFDLTQAPLLRARLLVTDDDQVLLIDTHHIVSDGWSLSVLFTDLATFYNDLKNNRHSSLQELRVQYADYAAWQRDWFDDAELQRQLSFWSKHLADADPVLELPADMPRPPEQSYRGSSTVRLLDKGISEGIKALAQEQRSTLFMTLLAAFSALLARYSRQAHIVVGTPIAGRNNPELENLIGFFSNTLALHSDLSGDPTFTELLAQVKDRTLQAYDHQDLPFEKLVEELRPERDMSHTPIFQTMFVLQNTPVGSTAFDGVSAESVNFEMGITKFDLLLEVRETANGLQAGFQYNSDIFLPQTMERMLVHFETLLGGIVANPATQLSALPLLDKAETETVISRFNATNIDYQTTDALLTPQRAVERQAEISPDAIAIEFGDEQISYRVLNARANQLARKLAALGAAPGEYVGICSQRSSHSLISLLAILKTGAAYVPIDPDYPKDRLSYMISNCHMRVLLVDDSTKDAVPANPAAQINLSNDYCSGDNSNLGIEPAADDPLYVIYTSGSTGVPKGVVLPQRALANLLAWQTRRPGFEHAARTLQYASLSFDVHHQEIFPTWASGGTLVLIDQELRQDLPALVRFISEARIQRLWMPFAALQPTAEMMAGRDDLSFSLEQICTSGEQLQVTPLIRKFFSKHPEVGFHNEYGPSEAHVVSIYSFAPGAERWAALPPIGKPVPNTRLYILDSNLQPCPVGVPGELYIAGEQLALSYLNQPEEAATKFIDEPFAGNNCQMYRTGDLARFLPDGNISYMGRVDEQVKFRGFRIEPGEIEAALANSANVKLAAVSLREDIPGDKRLVGYVTAETGKAIDTALLKTELQTQLPEYMVPAPIVVLDTMPTTPSGKISRRDLPAPDISGSADSYVAPRNDLETSLAGLWRDTLSIERIGIHDDFFELGGHSLLATQLVSRIRDIFQLELPLKYVFRNPTIAQLSEQISALQLTASQFNTDDIDDDDDLEEFEI